MSEQEVVVEQSQLSSHIRSVFAETDLEAESNMQKTHTAFSGRTRDRSHHQGDAWGTPIRGADEFGVPDSVMGQHPREFYGAVGRIACLSALLENQVLVVYETMTNSQQGAYRLCSIKQLTSGIRRELSAVEDLQSRQTISNYLDSLEPAFERRNAYVHSVFPAQPGERVFGHRPSRAKSDFDPARPSDILDARFEDLPAFIAVLVGLIGLRDRVYAAARSEQSRRLRLRGVS